MKANLNNTIKKGILKVPNGIISKIKKNVRTKINCIDFNANNNHSTLNDEEFEWLAAGTKEHHQSNDK